MADEGPADTASLRRHPSRQLARAAGINRATAQRAQHGLPVHPLCLAALLDAAKRLDADRGIPAAPSAPAVTGGCVQQCGGRPFRRGLCRSCYRKLRGAGLQLPPPGKRGVAPYALVRRMKRWLATLTADQIAALRGALERSA